MKKLKLKNFQKFQGDQLNQSNHVNTKELRSLTWKLSSDTVPSVQVSSILDLNTVSRSSLVSEDRDLELRRT